MKAVFLFPGQGAQYPQMGCDLYAESAAVRRIFHMASEVYGRDLYRILQQSDEQELRQTELTQMAITVVNVSAMTVLAERGVKADLCAGFSLGEYSALHCAGVLTLQDTLQTVLVRCRAMDKACHNLRELGRDPGMVAVLGLSCDEIAKVIEPIDDVYLANLNGKSQSVIAGLQPGLSKAEAALLDAGAMKTVQLAVSGPFHTPLLAEAQKTLAEHLATLIFHDPRIPVCSGVNGNLIRTAAEARKWTEVQICSAVQWVEVEQSLSEAGGDTLYEVGPGKVLAGLWRSHNRKVKVKPAGTLADMLQLGERV